MFTTAPDTTAPTVMSRTPAPNATMVPIASTIVVTFDEPVMGVSSSTFTVNNGAVVTGSRSSSNGGRTWTFSPLTMLGNNATVTVTLTTGITDLAGNPLASPVSWTFSTINDTTAPMVSSTLPLANATNIATNNNIVINFSEPVTNVTAASFLVDDGAGITGIIGVSNGGATWTFVPTGQMAGAVVVNVQLTSAITDLAGNPLPLTNYTFSTAGTGDMSRPSAQTFSPANNATNVPTNTTIAVTFSEPVVGVDATTFTIDAGGPVAGTRVASNGGRTWTFNPSAALPSGTLVTVMVTTGIVDFEGQTIFALTSSFTTQ